MDSCNEKIKPRVLAHELAVTFLLCDGLAQVPGDGARERLEKQLEADLGDGGVEAALQTFAKSALMRLTSDATRARDEGGAYLGHLVPNKGVIGLQLEERQLQRRLHRLGRQGVADLVPTRKRLSRGEISVSRRSASGDEGDWTHDMAVLGPEDHDHLAADLALRRAHERVVSRGRQRGGVDVGRKVADGGAAPRVQGSLEVEDPEWSMRSSQTQGMEAYPESEMPAVAHSGRANLACRGTSEYGGSLPVDSRGEWVRTGAVRVCHQGVDGLGDVLVGGAQQLLGLPEDRGISLGWHANR